MIELSIGGLLERFCLLGHKNLQIKTSTLPIFKIQLVYKLVVIY